MKRGKRKNYEKGGEQKEENVKEKGNTKGEREVEVKRVK
jgi:hypothetical protein